MKVLLLIAVVCHWLDPVAGQCAEPAEQDLELVVAFQSSDMVPDFAVPGSRWVEEGRIYFAQGLQEAADWVQASGYEVKGSMERASYLGDPQRLYCWDQVAKNAPVDQVVAAIASGAKTISEDPVQGTAALYALLWAAERTWNNSWYPKTRRIFVFATPWGVHSAVYPPGGQEVVLSTSAVSNTVALQCPLEYSIPPVQFGRVVETLRTGVIAFTGRLDPESTAYAAEWRKYLGEDAGLTDFYVNDREADVSKWAGLMSDAIKKLSCSSWIATTTSTRDLPTTETPTPTPVPTTKVLEVPTTGLPEVATTKQPDVLTTNAPIVVPSTEISLPTEPGTCPDLGMLQCYRSFVACMDSL